MTPRTVDELLPTGPVAIDHVQASRVSIPMIEPFRISSGEVSCKDAILLRLDNQTAFGWGESSAMPGAFYSHDTPDTCEQQLVNHVLPSLAGSQFADMRELEARLLHLNLSPFVRVAVETAAWELLARERNQSLRSLFGLAEAPVQSGLAIGLYPSLDDLHAALQRYRLHDYSRLKIKIKRGHDLALVQAIRDWYGDIPLMVDANADYSAQDIPTLCQFDPFHLMMLEQPFPREAIQASADLHRQSTTPICFDEGIETAHDVHRAVTRDACQIVNIKLQRVGGYLEALRVAEACTQHNLPFWMGTMPELGIGSAQALVLATHPACTFPTDVEPSTRWYQDDILQPELHLEHRALAIPPGPGIGFTVDKAKLDRYTVRRWTF